MGYIMLYSEVIGMPQLEKAKVFMSGRSQAVRIPAQFRFPGPEVYIRRDPQNGDVILSQGPTSLRDILAALDKLGVPDDFLSPSDRAQLPSQERTDI
jgi:antitoxin VapB